MVRDDGGVEGTVGDDVATSRLAERVSTRSCILIFVMVTLPPCNRMNKIIH